MTASASGPATPEAPSPCPRVAEAGAYLLGALPPSERADYAAHLDGCPYCLREVGQLAGLPGLLARRAPAVPPPGTGPRRDAPSGARRDAPSGPRPDPVAGALRETLRVRRRRRALVAAAFVLLAGLAVAGPVIRGAPARPGTGVTAAAELPVPMRPVGDVPVSAEVALNSRPWGTEVVMRCRYAGRPQSPVYVLVARAADGSTSELARWSGVADQDVVLAAATELPAPRLSELEVRNAAGTILLRADRPS